MNNKRFVISLIGLNLIYILATLYQNNIIAKIVSLILTFCVFVVINVAFYMWEGGRLLKLSGLFFSLSILPWFICDLMWLISDLILRGNPENNIVITNGYSLTNILLMISLLLSGYLQLKIWNKMHVFLDTVMIIANAVLLLWILFFEQNFDNIRILFNDLVGMISLITSIYILVYTNLWFLSIRDNNTPFFMNFTAAGGAVFSITDIIYHYYHFYQSYEPHPLLKVGYIFAFTLMGIASWLRLIGYERKKNSKTEKQQIEIGQLKKELLYLVVPIIIVIFNGFQSPYLLIEVTVIMFYFILTRYTQNNIHRDQLLMKERENVTELEKRVDERAIEIIKIMNIDNVTGFKNRKYLEEYIEKQIKTINRDEKIYLFFILQNKYKSFKSIYGKNIAEMSHKEVGQRIDHLIAEKNGLVAAYSDDVFIAVVKSMKPYEEAMSLAETIVKNCSGSYHIENYTFGVTLNIGIACYPDDTKNIDDLIRNADTAMLQARRIGYNLVRKYEEQASTNLIKTDIIEFMLKKVQFDEEFSLQYQPQVKCVEGEIVGVEALLRWYTKGGKYIPPIDFIPITETIGMIVPLGYWIMEQSLKQLSEWRKDHNTDIRMAINVSMKQLLDDKFIENMCQLLTKYEIPVSSFEIEITENIQLEDNTIILDVLNEISNMGISIALDDFGTGYSSLYYLKHLPVNRIKIAKELIDNIESDIYSKSIVQMVISISKVNNMKVIAEGVETIEQWECLKHLGCDEIQGYYFSKPLIPSEVENNWLN